MLHDPFRSIDSVIARLVCATTAPARPRSRGLRAAMLGSIWVVSIGCPSWHLPVVPDGNYKDAVSIEKDARGDLLVLRFTDDRDLSHRDAVGAWSFKFFGLFSPVVYDVIHLHGERTLAESMTRSFADAFEAAGYRVVVAGSPVEEWPSDFRPIATVDGSIRAFWLNARWRTTHVIEVGVSVANPEGESIWKGTYAGGEDDVTWLGLTNEEPESLVRRSLDDVLSQAIIEFSSEPFMERLQASSSPIPAPGARSAIPPETGSTPEASGADL